MDEALKRRLLGAAIIVILLVAVVPMFFENKPESDQGEVDLAPGPVTQKALDLPKPVDTPSQTETDSAASETAPAAAPTVSASKPAPKKATGYRLVQMNESTPKLVKQAPDPETREAPQDSAAVSAPVDQQEVQNEQAAEKMPAASSTKAKSVAAAVPRPPVASTVAPVPATPKPVKSVKPKESSVKPATVAEPNATSAPVQKPKLAASAAKSTAIPAAPAAAPIIKGSSPRVAESANSKATSVSESAKPVKPASDSSATWMVQAGSFATESNAHNLVDKLKKRNMAAHVTVTQTSVGPLYRVTVGSGLNRAKAEQIQKELESQDGVKGLIMQTR